MTPSVSASEAADACASDARVFGKIARGVYEMYSDEEQAAARRIVNASRRAVPLLRALAAAQYTAEIAGEPAPDAERAWAAYNRAAERRREFYALREAS